MSHGSFYIIIEVRNYFPAFYAISAMFLTFDIIGVPFLCFLSNSDLLNHFSVTLAFQYSKTYVGRLLNIYVSKRV